MCILLSMNYFRGEFIREYHYLYREIVKQTKRAWQKVLIQENHYTASSIEYL
jgi:hypothetical protein